MYAFLARGTEAQAYWISPNKKLISDLRGFGYKGYYKWSMRGLWVCMKAQEYHFSSYVSDVNEWTSNGAKRINYWHGTPFKKIENDIVSGSLRKYYNPKGFSECIKYILKWILRPAPRLKLHEIYSPNPYFDKYIKSAFRVNDHELVKKPYPRVDYLKSEKFYGGAEYLGSKDMPVIVKFCKDAETMLYAPTFRDADSGWFTQSFLKNKNIIQRYLEEAEIFLLVKLHPNEVISPGFLSQNILIVDSSTDIHLILARVNTIITDYSSICIDAAMAGLDTYLVWPDLDEYQKNSRDFYFDINLFFNGMAYKSIIELLLDLKGKSSQDKNVRHLICRKIDQI